MGDRDGAGVVRPFGGDLLIGNFGDGQINAFALRSDGTWQRVGGLRDVSGRQVTIDGLWGPSRGSFTASDANAYGPVTVR